MRVHAGGLAVSTIVDSTGFGPTEGGLALYGGIASGSIINSDGQEGVKSGGTDLGATVNEGGALFVESGGVASRTTVEGGGALIVLSGGSALLGNLADGGFGTVDGGKLEIPTGAAANGTIEFSQDSEGTLRIDGTTMPAATISGFVTSDTIDLAGVIFL